MPEEILDTEHPGKYTHPTLESIQWWEARRGTYNLILLATEFLMCALHWEGTLRMGLGGVLLWIVTYTIIANGCFCLGWGLSVLVHHYRLNFLRGLEGAKTLLFALGILFSLLLTVLWFRAAFFYPSLFSI